MEFQYVILSVMIQVLSVRATSDNASAACCGGSDIVRSRNRSLCWDAASNTTSPLRFRCLSILAQTNPFHVIGDKIQLILSPYFKPEFGFDDACTANLSIKRNGTIQVVPAVLICQNDRDDGTDDYPFDREILGYCMIVSVIFLALTAIIYTLLSELRDLFGKSIINFSIALAIGLGILAIINLMVYSDMTVCAVRGFLCYFFLLAAFFWSNSISIQVLKETRRPFSVDYGWNEFRWYMMYSWGVPAVLTAAMAGVNYHPGDHARPGIGLNTCWFFNKEQQWYYMYSVMSILILTNIGIFIYISFIVWRQTFSSTHMKALRYKFTMTIRLMVVMGVSWIFEMVGSLSGTHILWAIMDVFNCCQGVLIFLILVVFRKRVVKAMYRRGWMWCCAPAVERHLAVGDDAEQDVVQHTDIPMADDRTIS